MKTVCLLLLLSVIVAAHDKTRRQDLNRRLPSGSSSSSSSSESESEEAERNPPTAKLMSGIEKFHRQQLERANLKSKPSLVHPNQQQPQEPQNRNLTELALRVQILDETHFIPNFIQTIPRPGQVEAGRQIYDRLTNPQSKQKEAASSIFVLITQKQVEVILQNMCHRNLINTYELQYLINNLGKLDQVPRVAYNRISSNQFIKSIFAFLWMRLSESDPNPLFAMIYATRLFTMNPDVEIQQNEQVLEISQNGQTLSGQELELLEEYLTYKTLKNFEQDNEERIKEIDMLEKQLGPYLPPKYLRDRAIAAWIMKMFIPTFLQSIPAADQAKSDRQIYERLTNQQMQDKAISKVLALIPKTQLDATLSDLVNRKFLTSKNVLEIIIPFESIHVIRRVFINQISTNQMVKVFIQLMDLRMRSDQPNPLYAVIYAARVFKFNSDVQIQSIQPLQIQQNGRQLSDQEIDRLSYYLTYKVLDKFEQDNDETIKAIERNEKELQRYLPAEFKDFTMLNKEN